MLGNGVVTINRNVRYRNAAVAAVVEVDVVESGGPGCNQFQLGQGRQSVVTEARVDERRKYLALLRVGQVGGIKNTGCGKRILQVEVLSDVVYVSGAHFEDRPSRHVLTINRNRSRGYFWHTFPIPL